MTYDLTPARPIPAQILCNELRDAKAQAHFEKAQTGHISQGTIARVNEILAITDTHLLIQRARRP